MQPYHSPSSLRRQGPIPTWPPRGKQGVVAMDLMGPCLRRGDGKHFKLIVSPLSERIIVS